MAQQENQYRGARPAEAAQSRGSDVPQTSNYCQDTQQSVAYPAVRGSSAQASSFFVLNVDKLKSYNRLQVAARHNLREIACEIGTAGRIDAARKHLNIVVRGPNTAVGVMALERQLLADGKVIKIKKDGTSAKTRSECVRAIEFMVSLPTGTGISENEFFGDALEWIEQRYGLPILLCVIHHDERHPHMHVLVLPVKNNRWVGNNVLGQYATMQGDFYTKVAARYGLARKVTMPAAMRKQAARAVMAVLDKDPSLMQTPEFGTWLRNAIERNPEPMMALTGIAMPTLQPREKEWVKMMTRPMPIEPQAKPTGIVSSGSKMLSSGQLGEDRSLSCVRDRFDSSSTDAAADEDANPNTSASTSPPPKASPAPQPVIIDTDAAIHTNLPDADDEPIERFSREPDDLHPADYWDGDNGISVAPPPKPASSKALAQASVAVALMKVKAIRSTNAITQGPDRGGD